MPLLPVRSSALDVMCLFHQKSVASCCNEAFKIATSSAAYLNNYFMMIGTDGVYSYTFEHEKRNDCPVCGGESLNVEVGREWTVEQLIEILVERQDMWVPLSSTLLFQNAQPITPHPRADKSRSRLCPQEVNRYTSRRLHSWNKRQDRI